MRITAGRLAMRILSTRQNETLKMRQNETLRHWCVKRKMIAFNLWNHSTISRRWHLESWTLALLVFKFQFGLVLHIYSKVILKNWITTLNDLIIHSLYYSIRYHSTKYFTFLETIFYFLIKLHLTLFVFSLFCLYLSNAFFICIRRNFSKKHIFNLKKPSSICTWSRFLLKKWHFKNLGKWCEPHFFQLQ